MGTGQKEMVRYGTEDVEEGRRETLGWAGQNATRYGARGCVWPINAGL
jgi:hypothetical protein